MGILSRALIVTLLLALSGCDGPAAEDASLPIQPVQEKFPFEKIVAREPVRLFRDAAEVRLFVESGDRTESRQPIFIEEEGRLLTLAQRREVEKSISILTFAPNDTLTTGSACFIPHHYFQYYDKAGRKIGEAAVCFCCIQVQVNPDARSGLEQQYYLDHVRLKNLVRSMELPVDIECSDDQRKYLAAA